MTREEILSKALRHYGIKPQMIQATEELGELIQAIAKLVNERGTVENLAEEIADVRIMLDQIEMALMLEEQTRRIEGEKLVRLARRMEDDKGTVSHGMRMH